MLQPTALLALVPTQSLIYGLSMNEITYTLTDAEWAEALRAAMDASNKARFEDGNEMEASEIGVRAGTAKAHEITQRRGSIKRL